MDRQPAPAGVGGLGAPGERGDEVTVIELDFEGHWRDSLRKREGGLRQIDAVIMPDLGTGERRPHLACIAASNIEKGEGPWQLASARSCIAPVSRCEAASLSTNF
jgi:hypothetical protein